VYAIKGNERKKPKKGETLIMNKQIKVRRRLKRRWKECGRNEGNKK
jgi:hypothetical protein